jgi:hypothetical protein
MKIVFYLSQILVFILFDTVSAQSYSRKSSGNITPWEIAFSAGISSFVTSVNPQPGAVSNRINYWKRDINPAFGLSVVRNISPSIGLELNWINTHLSGTWSNKYPSLFVGTAYENPLKFNSKLNQIDLMVSFNLNQMMLPGEAEDIWHLYLKTGLGMSLITETKHFYPDGSKYSRLSFVLDGGFSYTLTDQIKLMAGSSFRFVNTDNLDGVHVVEADLKGNTTNYLRIYEIYNYTYVQVSYSFGEIGPKKHKSTTKSSKGKFKVSRKRK